MKKSTDKVRLGSFEIESGKVRISDPCYDKDTWCAGTIDNVKKGSWCSEIEKMDDRVSKLFAYHNDNRVEFKGNNWRPELFEVGVDSGQAGIYDEKYFLDSNVFSKMTDKDRKYGTKINEENIWYSFNCDVTLAEPCAGVIPFGCVSSSGYGDGCYLCSTIKEKGKIVAIMIDFGLDQE